MAEYIELVFLLVALIVIGLIAYLAISYYLKTEKEKLIVKIGLSNKEIITPVRLQAYERIVLLLERMEPSQIILRNITIGQSASMLHQTLVNTIREEFDHNLSQQLYISSEAWIKIKSAREAALTSINEAAASLKSEAPASELAELLFTSEVKEASSSIQKALEFVKAEARLLF